MAKKPQEKQYYEATGRRREAVARVRLYITGKDKTASIKTKKVDQGTILVNEKDVTQVFPREIHKKRYMLPFELTNTVDRFVVSVRIIGGGPNGQLEALMHGISRALCLVEGTPYRSSLKEHGLLTRDPRTRQRRQVGMGGKSRRPRQSPKR